MFSTFSLTGKTYFSKFSEFLGEGKGAGLFTLKRLRVFKPLRESECAVSGGNKLINGKNFDINFRKITIPNFCILKIHLKIQEYYIGIADFL